MLPLVQSTFEEPTDRPDLRDEPLVVHQRSEKTRNRALIIFVHGLGGRRYGEGSTWGNFPRFVFEDFPELDVGLYEFRTLLRRLRFWESVTLGTEAEVFAGTLRDAAQYNSFLLVGHSMGGLLCMEAIRYFLKSNQREELRRIIALFLMATPQAGSQRVPSFLSRFSKDFRALEPHGDFVTEIQRAFTNYILVDESASAAGREKIPAFAILGSHDQWVDGLSAGLGIPDSQKKSVRGSHTQIVKPPTKGHDAYLFMQICIEKRHRHAQVSSERKLVQPYLERLRVELEKRSYSNLPTVIPLSTQQGKLRALPPHQQGLAMDAVFLPRTSPMRPTFSPDVSQPEVSVEQFLCERTRIVLLGAPGAGKSTILRHLVLLFGTYWLNDSGASAAPGELLPGWWGRIPIFASLNQWQDPQQELISFLKEQVRSYGTRELAERLPGLMQEGRVVLLLDGLNELPQLNRDEKSGLMSDPRAKKIAKLGSTAQDREVGCVLSCRVKDFAGGPRWRDLHVLSLKEKQVEEFAKVFYHDVQEGNALVKNFLSELYDSANPRREKLHALAAQPFSLLGLLYYFQEHPAHELPDIPAELLENTVRATLAHAVQRELLQENQAGELRAGLSQLAFNMTDAEYVGGVEKNLAAAWLFSPREQEFQDGSGGHTPDLSPTEEATASELLRWARVTGLLYVAENEVQFHHQMFQEFFCARYCVEQELDFELLERATYPSFNEVWPLWSQLDPNLVPRLVELWDESELDSIQRNAVYALGQTGDTRAVDPLVRALADGSLDMDVRLAVTHALGCFKNPRVIELLIGLLREGYYETTLAAAQSLARLGESAVLPLMNALDEMNGVGLGDAVRALGWIGDSRALPSLERLLENPDVTEKVHTSHGVISENLANNAVELILIRRSFNELYNSNNVMGAKEVLQALGVRAAGNASDEEVFKILDTEIEKSLHNRSVVQRLVEALNLTDRSKTNCLNQTP